MSVYGIVLAGWSSNSKYSLLGGLRSASQMISYELSYGLALASVLVIANSLSLTDIVNRQSGYWLGFIPRWFIVVQPVGFLIYMISGVAETNRAPFDFPRPSRSWWPAITPSTASMAFAMFFLAEYINMVTVSAVATDLFLGGWHGPFLPESLGWIWFLAQDLGPVVLLHLDAVDAAALPLRPADAVRLEDPAAAGRGEPARDGRGGDAALALELPLFYVLRRRGGGGVGARHRAAQPDLQRDAAHRVVRGARGALRPARRAVRGGHPDHHLRRRHPGAVPVRGDAAERPEGSRPRAVAARCAAGPRRFGVVLAGVLAAELVWARVARGDGAASRWRRGVGAGRRVGARRSGRCSTPTTRSRSR